jgi:DnaJ-class molecular chaperone
MVKIERGATQRVSVLCAFCRGTGRDLFGIMSALSTCCVCGGTGTVSIEISYVRCNF